MPLLNFEAASPVRVQIKTGPAGLAGVLIQQDPSDPKRLLPIASYSHTLEANEKPMSLLELELRALHETLSKLRVFCAYCRKLVIEASPELRHLIRLAPKLHPRLWALIIDI